jgi:hypothetical protein
VRHRPAAIGAIVAVLVACVTLIGPGSAVAAPGDTFHSIVPGRLMDTRSGSNGLALGPGESRDLAVAGRSGIPTDATAVALNVTVSQPTTVGYVTVWPTGSAQPGTSNVNFRPGQTVANLVIVGLGTGGSISVFNGSGTAEIVVDATGWFGPGFVGMTPARVMDTRAGGGAFAAAEQRELVVAGVGGVPADAVAVALNVTATNPTATGYLTAWPAGGTRPESSNLNMVAGRTTANMVVLGLGTGGRVSLFNAFGSTDVLVDVMGYFTTGTGFTGISPARLIDTRSAIRFGPGETRTVRVAGAGGVPASGVGGAAINITAVNPSLTGYLTVWPLGQPQPPTSNLNMAAGQTVPNMVVVGVGQGGFIAIHNAFGVTDVLVDVLGWFDGVTPACPTAPVVLSGTGDSVVSFAKPAAGRPAVAIATYTGASNFIVWSLSAGMVHNDLLVNEIGAYAGTVGVDFATSNETVGFEITASGPWQISVQDAEPYARCAHRFAASVTGHGDEVLYYEPQASTATSVRLHNTGSGNFIVWLHTTAGPRLLVNEIGTYTGTVVASGPGYLTVESQGDWDITRQ